MSYKIRLPGRSSGVDEAHLLSGMERFWLTLEDNRRGILAGIAVVILAGAVIGGVIWYDHRQGQEAIALAEEANLFYDTQPPGDPQQAEKNTKQAITRYRRVVKEFPRASVAPLSLYRLGLAFERDNQIDEAIRAYEQFATTYGQNGSMLGLVYQRLGYVYLNKKQPDKAVQAFADVLAVPGARNKDHALYELGKLEEGEARPEGAMARYQELVQSYPSSPLASEANVRMRALEAKVPKPKEETAEKTEGTKGEEKPASEKKD